MLLPAINNRLLKINLISSDIENQIKDYSFKYYTKTTDKVEYGISLPLFTDAFHLFVEENQRIPTQEEFYQFYVTKYSTKLSSFDLTDEDREGLRTRICTKSYPSNLRELHACLLFKESNLFDSVAWDLNVDTKGKIDILGRINDDLYGIKLYVKTSRNDTMLTWKDSKSKQSYDNVKVMELAIDLDDSKRVGPFSLYDSRHLKLVRDFLYRTS